jgi:hypothetical protein
VEFDTILPCTSEDVFFSIGWPFFGVEFDVERLNGACNKSLNEKFVHFLLITVAFIKFLNSSKNFWNFLELKNCGKSRSFQNFSEVFKKSGNYKFKIEKMRKLLTLTASLAATTNAIRLRNYEESIE